MFYIAPLRHDILLEARYIGPSLKQRVRGQLLAELEGKCLGRKGFVIVILDIDDKDIHPGMIDLDTGGVNVTINYNAVLMRPFKNEVVDAIVTSASDDKGFICRVGEIITIIRINVHYYIFKITLFRNRTTGDIRKLSLYARGYEI